MILIMSYYRQTDSKTDKQKDIVRQEQQLQVNLTGGEKNLDMTQTNWLILIKNCSEIM